MHQKLRILNSQGNMPSSSTLSPSQNINYNDQGQECNQQYERVTGYETQLSSQNKSIAIRQHKLAKVSTESYLTLGLDLLKEYFKNKVSEDQMRKQFLEEIRQKKMEEYSQRVNMSKVERINRGKNVENQKSVYSNTHSFLNKEYKINLSQAKLQTQNEIYGTNQKSHKIIRQAHLKHQQNKIFQQQIKQQEGQYNYKQKIIKEAEQFRERQMMMTELEEVEEQYLIKLKVTQSKNRSMSAKKEEIKRLPAEKIAISKNNLFRIN